MEAVPRMPMLSFELKNSPKSAEFTTTLKRYISSKYNEEPGNYSKQCTELDQLRESAVRVSHDFMGCSTLKKYYSQLVFLQSRFPLVEGDDFTITFTWEDAHFGVNVELPDIRFEQAAILYNIGALHSILGASDSRTSSEGMKISCTHFQCAAWAFQHLHDSYPSNFSQDMEHTLLNFQIQIMLAQAQECILEKSMTDNRKSNITAKVAAQIVDYYQQAVHHLELFVNSPKRAREWRKRLDLKCKYYHCVKCLYLGQQADEQQKYGDRLAYYTEAWEKLEECQKMAKSDKNKEIIEALKFTADVIGGKYNNAKKENDFVYHEKVSEFSSLPDVKGASLVKGIAFDPYDEEISGGDIFAKLVPMEAHEASSLYSEEKAKLLREIGEEIEQRNEELVQFLASLQLDQTNLTPGAETLPEILLEKCAEFSVKPDAIQELVSAMQGISSLSLDAEGHLRQIDEMMGEDARKELEYEEIFGKRPVNNLLLELAKEKEKYEEGHQRASQNNEDLHKAMNEHITRLRLLMGPLEGVQDTLPTLEEARSSEDRVIIEKLLLLLNKVEEMKSQRQMLEGQVRKQIMDDDVTKILATKKDDVNLETFFKENLAKHDQLLTYIRQNLSAQENILRALTDTNAEYAGIRKETAKVRQQRQAMIDDYLESFEVYEDLLVKSQKGIDFYRRLEGSIKQLVDKYTDLFTQREAEREKFMGKIRPKVAPARPTAPKPNVPTDLPDPDSVPGMKIDPRTGALMPDPDSLALPGMAPRVTLPSQANIPNLPTGMARDPSMPPSMPSELPDMTNAPQGLTLKDFLPFMKPNTFGRNANRNRSRATGPDMTSLPGMPPAGMGGQPGMMPSHPGMMPGQQGMVPPQQQMMTSQTGMMMPPQGMMTSHPGMMTHPPGQYMPPPGHSPSPHGSREASPMKVVHGQQIPPQPNMPPQGGQYNNQVNQMPNQRMNNGQPYMPQNNMPPMTSVPNQPLPQNTAAHMNRPSPQPSPSLPALTNQNAATCGQMTQPTSSYSLPNIRGGPQQNAGPSQNQYAPPHSVPSSGPQNQPLPHQNMTSQLPPMQQHQQQQQNFQNQIPQNQNMGSGFPQQQQQSRPSPVPSPGPQQGVPPQQQRQNAPQHQQPNQQQQPYNQQGAPNQQQQPQHQYHQQYQQQQQRYQHPPHQQSQQQPAMPPSSQYQPVSHPGVPPQQQPQQSRHPGLPPQQQQVPGQHQQQQHYQQQQQAPQQQHQQQQQQQQQFRQPTPQQGQHMQQPHGQPRQPNQMHPGQMTQPGPMGQPVRPNPAVRQVRPPGPQQMGQQGPPQMGQRPMGPPQQPGQQQQFRPQGSQPIGQQRPAGMPAQHPGQYVQQPGQGNQMSSVHPALPQPMQNQPNQMGQPRAPSPQMGKANQQIRPPGPPQGQYSPQMGRGQPTAGYSVGGGIPPQYRGPQQGSPHHQPQNAQHMPGQRAQGPQGFAQGQGQGHPSNVAQMPPGQHQHQQQYNPYMTQGPQGSPQRMPGNPQQQQFRLPVSQGPAPGSQAPPSPQPPGHLPTPLMPSQPMAPPTQQQQPMGGAPAPTSQSMLPPNQPMAPPTQSTAPPTHPMTPPMYPRHGSVTSEGSCTDDLLSSSPGREKDDNVLRPKVLTEEDIQRQKEEELRESIVHQPADPFTDHRQLDRFYREVQTYQTTVENLTVIPPGQLSQLDLEWKELVEEQERESRKLSMAIARCYSMKNRSPDIMPYDESRVSISLQKDDYINASHMDSLASSCPKLIATQAPLPVTYSDFWLMVYEQGSEVVVMLLRDEETNKGKPHVYWPVEKGQRLSHGPIELTLQGVKEREWWTERLITVCHRDTRNSRTIILLQFTAWPTSPVSESVSPLLEFIGHVHYLYTQQRNLMKPVIVHCSHGVGRTGVFCVVYTAVQEMNQGRGIINVKDTVKKLRQRRKYMVDEKDQYRLCYAAILAHAHDILVKYGRLPKKPSGEKLERTNSQGHKPDESVLGDLNTFQDIQSTVAKFSVKQCPADDVTNANDVIDVVSNEDVSVTVSESTNGNIVTPNDAVQQGVTDSGNRENGNVLTQPPSQRKMSTEKRSESPLGGKTSSNNSRSNSPMIFANLPPKLADLQDPSRFSLDAEESRRNKVTKSNFAARTGSLQANPGDPGDPLCGLDPLWSTKKS